MSKTWILVAESSRAKVYKANGRRSPITEIDALVHPECRMHEGDLVTDTAGSDGGSVGQGRHVLENKISAKDHESLEFARELASYLESARTSSNFDRLVLIAPPAFLGNLRHTLSKEVMSLVSRQVDKNLVQKSPEVVRGYL